MRIAGPVVSAARSDAGHRQGFLRHMWEGELRFCWPIPLGKPASERPLHPTSDMLNPSTTANPTEPWVAGPPPAKTGEMERLAEALTDKFEELSLIHQLSERLTLDEDTDVICESLLDELTPCINADTLAIDLNADDDSQFEAMLFQSGVVRDHRWLDQLSQQTFLQSPLSSTETPQRTAISNAVSYSEAELRVIVVTIERQGKHLGRMIAVRHGDL
ncbi:MAG: hypothetical protein MI861_16855, partial [Pirellulales bacterium]|nr:hypothetical protein [Pirellulales bacterium]